MKKLDIIIIASVLILALGAFAVIYIINSGNTSDKALVADVYLDGNAEYSLALDKDIQKTVSTSYGYNIITVKDGSVRVSNMYLNVTQRPR